MFELYDDSYIAKAIKNDFSYGTEVTTLNPLEGVIALALKSGMGLVAALIRALAAIPIVSSLLEMFVSGYPRGAVGFFLRGAYYKCKLKHLGKNVLIDQGVSIWKPQNVEIGDNTHIDTNVKIEGNGPVKIGRYNHICSFVILQGRGGITIGDYVGIAAGCFIYSASNGYKDGKTNRFYSPTSCAPADEQTVYEGPVRIGNYVGVGLSTIINPGVTLHERSFVGMASVVNKDVPSYMAGYGSPIRLRTIPERPLEDERTGRPAGDVEAER